MQTVEIELYDVKMQVIGRYTRGSAAEVGHSDPSRCSPAEPGEFEVDKVYIGEVDVTEFVETLGCFRRDLNGCDNYQPIIVRVADAALEAAEEAGL